MLAAPASTDHVVDMQHLLNILLELDFKSIRQPEPILSILQRIFPHLSVDELQKIEKKTAKLIQANKAAESTSEVDFFYIKLSVAVATTVTGLYFGGPLVASGTKAALTQVYSLVFGTPNPDTYLYGLLFTPCEKALSKLALAYGPYIAGITAGTSAFSSLSFAESVTARLNVLRKWAFDSHVTLTPQRSTSLKSIDEILAEFDMLSIEPEALPKVQQLDNNYTILPAYRQTQRKQNVVHPNQAAISADAVTVNKPT